MALTSVETNRRTSLKDTKPLAYEKIIKNKEKLERGESVAMIDFAYDYKCNLRCRHCIASKIEKKEKAMTIEDIRNMAVQADEMGMSQFTISGGEPLLFKDLDNVFNALMPEKFHLSLSTNGMFLDLSLAKHLKSIGLDKIKISVDDFSAELHNKQRGNSEAYDKMINALMVSKEAELQVVMQHVVTHQNAKSQSIIDMCEFAKKHGFDIGVLLGRQLGEWDGNEEILIDEDDAQVLRKIHEKYPFFVRDVFSLYGKQQGCVAVKGTLHVTKYGDVLPCGFIQISMGNLFEESLKDIVNRSFNIKYFKNFHPICLSGEDRDFINKYMKPFYGKPAPHSWKDVFTAEDFVDPNKM